MKKYLLTFLLWLFAFFGFTSAELITFEWNQNTKVYSPNTITFWQAVNITYDNYTDYISNISCNVMTCHISIWNCNIAGSSDFMRDISNCNLSAWTYEIGFDSNQYMTPFKTITIDNLSSSSGGWSTEEDWFWTILTGWLSVFTPVIDWVWTVVKEFIPYVVYLSIWLLVVVLGFIALKWLMNWMSSKVIWTFSSRRRK